MIYIVSHRRNSSGTLVKDAYISPIDNRYDILLGKRDGESSYCANGAVSQADKHAARNVLARLHDSEIGSLGSFSIKVDQVPLAGTDKTITVGTTQPKL